MSDAERGEEAPDHFDDRPPSYEDMMRFIEATPLPEYEPDYYEADYQAQFSSVSTASQEEFAHLRGLVAHYRHKGAWSYFLIAVMASLIGFQCFLLAQVGSGAWDFTAYDWLLPLLLVQNFAQIIGLAVFVVKALFKPLR